MRDVDAISLTNFRVESVLVKDERVRGENGDWGVSSRMQGMFTACFTLLPLSVLHPSLYTKTNNGREEGQSTW